MNECPNCHANDSFNAECFDEEFFGNSYYTYVTGTCTCCGKTYRWTEVYKFSETIDIEEVTDN